MYKITLIINQKYTKMNSFGKKHLVVRMATHEVLGDMLFPFKAPTSWGIQPCKIPTVYVLNLFYVQYIQWF